MTTIKKTYGVKGLMEWVARIQCGKTTINVPFTGGTLTGYGESEAEYTTENPVVQLQTFAALQCKRHSSFHFHTVAKLRPQAMNNPRRNKFPQVRASTSARHASETFLHPPNPVKPSYN